ncbi:hypothetical protein PR048_009219 [Dryococelus australis]|uniref:Uncharacterized protein n=1 Tax=Dryococelus australis TaxID=614101 RepID=A0ABQ9I145_9NEOP|nr:hypothetical protein PR048_009219 [Dryococelus australis]
MGLWVALARFQKDMQKPTMFTWVMATTPGIEIYMPFRRQQAVMSYNAVQASDRLFRKCYDNLPDLPLTPENGVPPNGSHEKLLLTLMLHKKYVIHGETMRQYLMYGVKLDSVHHVLHFEQKAWMAPYIDNMSISFLKLKNNNVYGKTLQNVLQESDIRVVSRYDMIYGAAELIEHPTFQAWQIIDENFVLIKMLKSSIVFNKFLNTAVAVLDLSKLTLYEFHYQ